MEKDRIKDLLLDNLRDHFDLFDESHKVNVHQRQENICINYRTVEKTLRKIHGTTHFDIHKIGDVCYILYIELAHEKRGNGFGWQMYQAIHHFAHDFGCKSVRTTPSGWTPKGKTRRDYLLERGYIPCGENELEFLLK